MFGASRTISSSFFWQTGKDNRQAFLLNAACQRNGICAATDKFPHAQDCFLTRTASAINKTDKCYFFADLRKSPRSLRNGTKIRRARAIILRLHTTNNTEFHTLSSKNSVKLNNSADKTFLQFLHYFIIIAKKIAGRKGFVVGGFALFPFKHRQRFHMKGAGKHIVRADKLYFVAL